MKVKDKNTVLRQNFDDFKLHYSLKNIACFKEMQHKKNWDLQSKIKLGIMIDHIKYFSIEQLSIKCLEFAAAGC